MSKNFLQKIGAFIAVLVGLNTYAANITVSSDITASTSWTNDNNYILYGDIIIKSGVTLTIQEGTIIRGDKTTLSRLVVATGGKLIAQGTPEQPIVFTSNQPAGSRGRGDWAGIAVCGLAPVNLRNAQGAAIQGRLECGTTTDYDFGGNVPNDNSGVISYVRIEYAGYVCGANSELNSLTLGGVGSLTKIDHVMVSYGQDDGFEWFGGTANASNLISFGSRDDDFDTDNGFSGQVQYGLVIRVDTIADQGDISNAFESDNDANGTYNDPYTKAVFSNITVVGPAATVGSTIDSKYGWGARLRRSTGLNIFNSMFIGYKRGLRLEGTATQLKATNDTLQFDNNIIAGSKEQYYETAFDSLYLLAHPSNTIFGGNANDNVNLVYPYGNPDMFNFTPQAGSPALTGASFTNPKLAGLTTGNFRGAIGTDNWATCWAEYSPQNEDYTAGPINYAFTATVNNAGPLTFCEGGSVALNTNTNANGASYLWSNGATTSSITATTSGTYTVTVTSARGCVRTATKTVVVNPNPATPVITPSATSFCTGSNGVSLQSSAATGYNWSNGGNTQSINVTFGGTYNVTVSDANQCTASAVAVIVTENTPTVPTIAASGATTFCTGGSVDVAVNSPSNFASFNWSNNATTNTITVTATGTYSVTTTDNNGCTAESNTVTTNVSNAPTPTISANGATTFCGGDTVTLTATSGDTYLWSNNATTQSIDVTTSGTYSVSVTNSNACNGVGNSNAINVTVAPQPVAGFTSATQGAAYTIAFTNTTTNGTTYNWSFGDNQSSATESPVHTYTANGTYTVTLTATNGNCTDVSTGTVTITSVGVEEVVKAIDAIRLYPNPNNGKATLEVSTSTNADVVISVMDVTGRTLSAINTELVNGTNLVSINTEEFAGGIYFVSVRNGMENNVVRMVVNK
ncbi:MAG TPA: PKD domain-containing protein [Chitinophagales bacterium]|nr:PKD domain-containing protein [Chitinophagales bacterium]